MRMQGMSVTTKAVLPFYAMFMQLRPDAWYPVFSCLHSACTAFVYTHSRRPRNRTLQLLRGLVRPAFLEPPCPPPSPSSLCHCVCVYARATMIEIGGAQARGSGGSYTISRTSGCVLCLRVTLPIKPVRERAPVLLPVGGARITAYTDARPHRVVAGETRDTGRASGRPRLCSRVAAPLQSPCCQRRLRCIHIHARETARVSQPPWARPRNRRRVRAR